MREVLESSSSISIRWVIESGSPGGGCRHVEGDGELCL